MKAPALRSLRATLDEAIGDVTAACRARVPCHNLGVLLRVELDPGAVYNLRFLNGTAIVRPDGIEVRDNGGRVLAWDGVE